MTTGSLMARSGCKACGAQPPLTATTQATWCASCGACCNCGEPNVIAQATWHRCPGGTGAVHLSASLKADILASGPIRPGYHSAATYADGREAPMEACEMPASSGGAAWAATVEACARAACEAHPSDPEWAISTDAEREMWRKVARAVLAAAGRGVR